MLEIFLFNSKFISTINDEIKENFNNQTKFKTFYILNFLFENIKKNNRKLLLNFYFDQKENKLKYSKYFSISFKVKFLVHIILFYKKKRKELIEECYTIFILLFHF